MSPLLLVERPAAGHRGQLIKSIVLYVPTKKIGNIFLSRDHKYHGDSVDA